MRYRFRIDLRVLKRGAPPGESVELSSADEPEEVEPLVETGDPRVKAYNASLNWARSQHPGKFVTGGLDYNVFLDEGGGLHVLTRPRGQRRERLSEVVVFPDGQLLSRNLTHQQGDPLDLDELFLEGLDPLDLEDEALARFGGYELQATNYLRRDDRLLGVEKWQRYFDPATQSVVQHESYEGEAPA